MRQVINYVAVNDIVAEYKILENWINKTYGTKFDLSERILYPIIETHIKAILDERTFTLFRTFDDHWEVGLLNIFINGVLTDEEVINISRSKYFDILNRSIKSLIHPIMETYDPNFTIWEVNLEVGSETATVISSGDYRIEQWHKEHNVTKLNVTDSVILDISHIFDFIKHALNYHQAPAYLTDKRKRKENYYDGVINTLIYDSIKNTRQSGVAATNALMSLKKLSLIDDHLEVQQRIKTYLDYELFNRLEKIGVNRIITGYVLCGKSISINFGGIKFHTANSKTFHELELEQADFNGDYIPEKLRRL